MRKSIRILFLSLLTVSSRATSAGEPAADWTLHALDGDFDLNEVVWTGSQWVAVGGSFSGENIVYTSPDGAAWTRRPVTGTTQDGLEAVCWTGTQLVAVGPEGNVLTSPDGIAWTQRANAWPEAWVGVAWTGNLLIAVTGVGKVLTSPDGIAWDVRMGGGGNGGAQAYFNAVAWNGSQAVAVGGTGSQLADGCVFTSADGLVWTERALDNAPGLRSVAWAGTRWVAVGGIYDGNGEKAASHLSAASPDGIVWTVNPDSAVEILESVVWTGNGLLAVGWDGTRMTSKEGSGWERIGSDTLSRLLSVTWSGTRLTAVGWNGTLLTMPLEKPADTTEEPPVDTIPEPPVGISPAAPVAYLSRPAFRIASSYLIASRFRQTGWPARAVLFAPSGRKVREARSQDPGEIRMPIAGLAPGRYLLQIQGADFGKTPGEFSTAARAILISR